MFIQVRLFLYADAFTQTEISDSMNPHFSHSRGQEKSKLDSTKKLTTCYCSKAAVYLNTCKQVIHTRRKTEKVEIYAYILDSRALRLQD